MEVRVSPQGYLRFKERHFTLLNEGHSEGVAVRAAVLSLGSTLDGFSVGEYEIVVDYTMDESDTYWERLTQAFLKTD